MIQRLVAAMTRREEKRLGASLEYVRYMSRHSVGALMKFSKLKGISEFRRVLPKDVFHTAKLVGALHEDCGSCVQIAVNVAKEDGVAPDLIRAVLAGDTEALPETAALAHRFTAAVANRSHDEGELRDELLRRYGDKGVIEMALAIGSAQIFPVVKRALGYAEACATSPATV